VAWSWIAFALPLGLNCIEGAEASLLAAAAVSRGGWRKTIVACLAALVTLAPLAVGIYFAYRYIPSDYIDYGIAALIFLLGARELREGLGERAAAAARAPFKRAGERVTHPAAAGIEAKAVQQPQNAPTPSWFARRLGSWTPVWPAYVGGVLESSEAVLYTFGVSHGSGSPLASAVGGTIGFVMPWMALAALRRLIARVAEWKVELSIGIALMSAASLFAALRATGVLGG
jgi:uncharacterized membrane protein